MVSDYNPFVDEGEDSPPEDGPIDDGVATDDGQPTEQPVYEEPKNYLDVDEVADRYVRLKVDGEEIEVPFGEAIQGYSRTADYTRKTQELAQQRQEAEYALTVQRALQAQPAEALRLLAQQYGVQFPQSPPVQGREQPSNIYDDGGDDDDNPYADPLERRLNQQQQVIDQMMARDAQRDADVKLRAAVGGLQTKYNLDEATVREVVGTALQYRMGPESFEMIYKNLAFDRAQQARAEAQANRQQTEQQRRAAAERASQVVGNGRSANGAGGPPPSASDGRMSINEAYDAALRAHGVG
jgi:hypothetical protein